MSPIKLPCSSDDFTPSFGEELHQLLDYLWDRYDRPEFIPDDPIAIPHQYSRREDIEISAFFAATIAWGKRSMIVSNGHRLMERMDHAPYDFVVNASEQEWSALVGFVHRTFNDSDCIDFVRALRPFYLSDYSVNPAPAHEIDQIHQQSSNIQSEHSEPSGKQLARPVCATETVSCADNFSQNSSSSAPQTPPQTLSNATSSTEETANALCPHAHIDPNDNFHDGFHPSVSTPLLTTGLGGFFEQEYAACGDLRKVLSRFRSRFWQTPHAARAEKHLASIDRGASCKRLNMFLRWMVRRDDRGVDFGLWPHIPASALYIPLDLHSSRTARELGLLFRKQNDWKAVEELTAVLRKFDPADPIKYDYALFGAGIHNAK